MGKHLLAAVAMIAAMTMPSVATIDAAAAFRPPGLAHRTPPGWRHGVKRGWHGSTVPPGFRHAR
jgi:hypothetical protein